ncbi:hypothetical protein Tco_0854810 [Tanacetum coccineum]
MEPRTSCQAATTWRLVIGQPPCAAMPRGVFRLVSRQPRGIHAAGQLLVNGGRPPVNHREPPPDHCSTVAGPLVNHHRTTGRVMGRVRGRHVAPPEWATWHVVNNRHPKPRQESNLGPQGYGHKVINAKGFKIVVYGSNKKGSKRK